MTILYIFIAYIVIGTLLGRYVVPLLFDKDDKSDDIITAVAAMILFWPLASVLGVIAAFVWLLECLIKLLEKLVPYIIQKKIRDKIK